MANVNVNTYGDLTPRSSGALARQLLDGGQYLYVIGRHGQGETIPKGKTKTLKFRRYEDLPRATSPLAEAVPPAAGKLQYTDVSVTLEQYGYYVPLSDVVLDTHEDPITDQVKKLCSKQIFETNEVITIGVLKGGTNVFYANSASSRSNVASAVLRGDLRRVYRYFRKYKAEETTEIIKASSLVSTEPVSPAFFAFGHTDLDADIRAIDGFVPAAQYSNSGKALPGEIGKVDQFRFILTALFDPWDAAGASGTAFLSGGTAPSAAAACDVYPLLIVAKDAFGTVRLQGSTAVTPMLSLPKPQVGDELGQVGFVSWKTYLAAVILNQNWIARVECAATANPT
jgi:N4-gp56 family major capsid protein